MTIKIDQNIIGYKVVDKEAEAAQEESAAALAKVRLVYYLTLQLPLFITVFKFSLKDIWLRGGFYRKFDMCHCFVGRLVAFLCFARSVSLHCA